MNREELVEEVAEVERALSGTILNQPQLIEQANQRLDYLRNQAASLGMPTSRIQQLKLQLQAKLAKGGDDVLDVPEGTTVIPMDQVNPDALRTILGQTSEVHDAPNLGEQVPTNVRQNAAPAQAGAESSSGAVECPECGRPDQVVKRTQDPNYPENYYCLDCERAFAFDAEDEQIAAPEPKPQPSAGERRRAVEDLFGGL